MGSAGHDVTIEINKVSETPFFPYSRSESF